MALKNNTCENDVALGCALRCQRSTRAYSTIILGNAKKIEARRFLQDADDSFCQFQLWSFSFGCPAAVPYAPASSGPPHRDPNLAGRDTQTPSAPFSAEPTPGNASVRSPHWLLNDQRYAVTKLTLALTWLTVLSRCFPLIETSATLVVTGALLVVTRSY